MLEIVKTSLYGILFFIAEENRLKVVSFSKFRRPVLKFNVCSTVSLNSPSSRKYLSVFEVLFLQKSQSVFFLVQEINSFRSGIREDDFWVI